MAADQLKKRLNAATVIGYSFRDQYRAKKKNLGSQYDLNLRSHVSLEWDDNQKRVFAKKEQISITRRDLTPFIDSVPHCHNILADVFAIPQEIFELDNLMELLSYEVWQTHLSEKERNNLTQFLPRGSEAQQVVQALLVGDNFHFGNPFLKWGASLCSGNLHPDVVLHQEQCFRANKKAYYSELQKYHNDIIGNLQNWKERWASCKDPEKEILQKIWRSRKLAEKNISSHANEYGVCEAEESLAATSESCSWVADERACSSDNQNSSMMKGGELQKREGFMKDKCRNPLVASDGLKVVARPRKGEKLHKRNIHCNDGAKYMSYFKISKKQHELVKSMKQSGNSIQSRYLNHVLGNLDSFQVQPYELFEEEEKKKLHEHWLQLANRDLPIAFENWRKRQSQIREMTKSLEQEMEEKLKSLIEDEEKENPNSVLQERKDNGATDHESTMEADEESVPASTQSQPQQQIPSLNDSHDEFNPMDMDSEDNHVISEPDDAPPNISEFSGNLNPTDVAVSQGVPLSSARDVWPAVGMPNSYYHSTLSHDYASASELSLGHPQVIEEPPARLIDLESDLREEDTGKDMLHRQSNAGSFFSTYPNQDRNELLQSFFKGQGILAYHHEQKQMGLDFQPTTNVLMETGQFSGHFGEQLQSPLQLEQRLEQRQKRQNELYMQQNFQEKTYSDGGRYSIPRQEHFSPINMQDWAVNPVRMSAPLQSHLNGGELLSQNWFSGGHRARGGWSDSDGPGVPNQNIGSNADESLFCVLSQCNELRSGIPYDSMGSTEQLIPLRNFGGVGGGVSRSSNVSQQIAHPLNNLSGREAAALKTNNMGWTSLPHQNSALHDSMGKPFVRSWNQ